MSREVFIAPIVEGHGEVHSLPVLLRRVAEGFDPTLSLRLNPALRVRAGSFLHDDAYFRRYVELAARKAKVWPGGSVLIVLDSEDDCPADLGPSLALRARSFRADVKFEVILAHREYETWFLAAAESLRSVCGLPKDLESPAHPESIRGAKQWLSQQMGAPYNESEHQPRMTAAFAFEQASRVPSFGRALGKLRQMLG